MAIDQKDVYCGMRIVRNAAEVNANSKLPAYSGEVVSVTGITGVYVDTSDGTIVNLEYMDAYVEPFSFKVGDEVICVKSHYSAIPVGSCGSVIKVAGNLFYVNFAGAGTWLMQGYELSLLAQAEKLPKPFALTIGTLSFDSLESLSQAITEGIVQVLDSSPESVWAGQEKVQRIRVKDGWVCAGDMVWVRMPYGPVKVYSRYDRENMKNTPEMYSIKKPQYIGAKAGYYTGNYDE